MDLTWRDAVATLALVTMLTIYGAFLSANSKWLLASPWATAAVLLIVGLAGLVVSVRGEVHGRSKELFAAAMRITASVFGIIALLAGLAAMLADSAYALKILVMASIVVWSSTTLSHI
jgi:hypothetical protein